MDVTGQAISNQAHFAELLDIFIDDKNLDIILIGMTAMPFPGQAAENIVQAVQNSSKPIIVLWSFDKVGEDAYSLIKDANIPLFHTSDLCLKGIKHLIEFSQFKSRIGSLDLEDDQGFYVESIKSKSTKFLSEKSGVLSEYDSKKLLNFYGIPIIKEKFVNDVYGALWSAAEIGYPVVLKGISPKIIHKTEAGLVKLNLHNDEDVIKAFTEIQAVASRMINGVDLDGFLVQDMVTGGIEIFTGLINDQVFGPGILFRLGGTFVELFDDKTVGIPPLTHHEAREMITSIKGSRLLQGYRGQHGYDLDALADLLMKLGQLGLDLRDFISEIDINPVIVFRGTDGVCVIDATVKLKKESEFEEELLHE